MKWTWGRFSRLFQKLFKQSNGKYLKVGIFFEKVSEKNVWKVYIILSFYNSADKISFAWRAVIFYSFVLEIYIQMLDVGEANYKPYV